MFSNKTKDQSRFSLYFLEEGEIYIKEYMVELKENEGLKRKGILYLGSRSIIFEPNEPQSPIEKFMFKSIGNYLVKDQDGSIVIKGNNSDNESERLVSSSINFNSKNKYSFLGFFKRKVVILDKYQPYKYYDSSFTVEMSFIYELGNKTWELFMKVIHLFQSKTGFEVDSINILDLFYKFELDLTRLKSINEICLLKKEIKVNKILPLIEIPGMIMLTDARIYYQPIYILNSKKSYSIVYKNIKYIYKRRLKLKEIGIEIIYIGNKSQKEKNMLIEFPNYSSRESVYELICQQIPNELNEKVLENTNLNEVTKKWMAGTISNYDYLIFLNSASNRSRNNLSQYPVFPWILNDYRSCEIDLEDKNNYRDLSRPIGKLNDKRFKSFKERYYEMPEPKYLYGTHYSTPAYVIGYLVRLYPEYMVKLQAGKYDHPDRLFSSIEIDWEICLTNAGSLKELIPEFFEEDPSFLINGLNLKLGLKDFNGVS